MAVAISQSYAVMLEKVSNKLPDLYSLSQLTKKLVLDRMPAEKVSAWYAGSGAVLGFRMPVKQFAGGDLAVVSLDNAAFPAGSMPTYQFMTIGYAPLSLSFLLPTGAMMATASADQATKNVFKDTLDGGLKSFGDYEDSLFFTAGDGILATGIGSGANPSGTNPVYTLEPNFGPQRLALGQLVDVWTANGITLKNAAAVYVTAIDPVAKTATLTGTVTSPLNSDLITVANLPGPIAAGQTRLGLYNYNSATTTGTTNGLSRSTVPELVTPAYNAGGSAITPASGLTLSDYIIQRRSEEAIGSMTGISHMAQRQAVWNMGDSITEIQAPAGRQLSDSVDRVTKNVSNESGKFYFAGVEHYVSRKADRSRIDWINRDLWKTVELAPMAFFKQPSGQYMFEGRSSTTGGVKTSTFFALLSTTNIASLDPGCAGYIYGAQLPSGY